MRIAPAWDAQSRWAEPETGRRVSHVLRSLVMVTLFAAPAGQLAADPARVGASQNWDVENASSNESSAEKALRIGIRAYVTGDLKLAIASLGTALQGPLPSNQTARALYYRGLAHRKQGMPGWAISDLTRALQQQDGLSDAERSDAEDNRTAASREAGLPATESAVVTLSPAEEAPIASAALAVRNPAPAASKNPAPALFMGEADRDRVGCADARAAPNQFGLECGDGNPSRRGRA